MRWGLSLLAGLALVAGCRAPDRFAVLRGAVDGPPHANLALGNLAEQPRLAMLYTGRSDWPAVEHGYRVDDVTFYEKMTYDVQSHYDRHGSLYAGAQSIQTGVWLR